MNRKLLLSVLSIILVIMMVGLAGCGQNNQQDSSGQQQEPREQTLYTIGTHPTGTLHHTLGTGIATVLDDALAERFNVLPVSGPGEWGPLLKTGEVDFGVANNWDSQMSWLGGSVYAQVDPNGFPMRTLFKTLFFEAGLVVAKDSGIETFEDLRGKRVVTEFTSAPGSSALTLAALAVHGLSEDDVRGISVPSLADGVNAIREGRADAAYAATGMGVVTELDATRGALFLNFDPTPENWAKGNEIIPTTPTPVVPREGLVAIDANPTYLQGYRSYFLARENLSEEMAYTIVKAFAEDLEKFQGIHANFANLTLEAMVGPAVTVPYHDGAIRYYKEVGIWTDELQARQDELLGMK